MGHRRLTKTQIFNAVYGPCEESVNEVVVEGHVSKLRKKLRLWLGRDVIDAKRFLGYRFVGGGTSNGSAGPATAMAAKVAARRPDGS